MAGPVQGPEVGDERQQFSAVSQHSGGRIGQRGRLRLQNVTREEIEALNRAAAKHAVSELTYAAKALVKQQLWRLSAFGAAAMVAGGLACGGIGAAAVWATTPALTVLDPGQFNALYYRPL